MKGITRDDDVHTAVPQRESTHVAMDQRQPVDATRACTRFKSVEHLPRRIHPDHTPALLGRRDCDQAGAAPQIDNHLRALYAGDAEDNLAKATEGLRVGHLVPHRRPLIPLRLQPRVETMPNRQTNLSS